MRFVGKLKKKKKENGRNNREKSNFLFVCNFLFSGEYKFQRSPLLVEHCSVKYRMVDISLYVCTVLCYSSTVDIIEGLRT